MAKVALIVKSKSFSHFAGPPNVLSTPFLSGCNEFLKLSNQDVISHNYS